MSFSLARYLTVGGKGGTFICLLTCDVWLYHCGTSVSHTQHALHHPLCGFLALLSTVVLFDWPIVSRESNPSQLFD